MTSSRKVDCAAAPDTVIRVVDQSVSKDATTGTCPSFADGVILPELLSKL